MSKTSSVFVVDGGDFYESLRGAFSTLDSAKDYVLSEVLLDVLDGDKYTSAVQMEVHEYVGEDCIRSFEVSCQGFDYSVGKVLNVNKMLETLDLQCVTPM
jgi:hypothetical protein